jgi:hypothetical protein
VIVIQDQAIKRFPEVVSVWGKAGRAETATDPAGLGRSLGNQALIRMNTGDLNGALRLLNEQETICRRLKSSPFVHRMTAKSMWRWSSERSVASHPSFGSTASA